MQLEIIAKRSDLDRTLVEGHAHLEAGDPEPRPNAQLHRALDAAEGVEVEGRVGKAARRHRAPPAARRHVRALEPPVDSHDERVGAGVDD